MESLIINTSGGGGGLSSAYAYVYVKYNNVNINKITCTHSIRSIDINSNTKIFLLEDNTASCNITGFFNNEIYTTRALTGITANTTHNILLTKNVYLVYNGDPCFSLTKGYRVGNMTKTGSGNKTTMTVDFLPQPALTNPISSVDPSPNETYCLYIRNNLVSTKDGYNICHMNTALDLTPYKQINIEFAGRKSKSTVGRIQFSIFKPNTIDGWNSTTNRLIDADSNAFLPANSSVESGTLTVDISAINEEGIIGFGFQSSNADNQQRLQIYNMWLVPND